MIDAAVDASRVVATLRALPAKLRTRVERAVRKNTQSLLGKVREKLSGEVLNARSGALRDSFVETGLAAGTAAIADGVASDGSVPYARIQEYGGRINIPEIEPRAAKVLAFAYGGRLVFARRTAAHTVEILGHGYLRASLAEQSDALIEDIRKIVAEAIA
jgi:hypothetical protein